jgi:hypothetical protein
MDPTMQLICDETEIDRSIESCWIDEAETTFLFGLSASEMSTRWGKVSLEELPPWLFDGVVLKHSTHLPVNASIMEHSFWPEATKMNGRLLSDELRKPQVCGGVTTEEASLFIGERSGCCQSFTGCWNRTSQRVT